jgi:cytochrome c553
MECGPLIRCSRGTRRNIMRKLIALSAMLVVAPCAGAADVAAGKARAETVCAACHGANGVSVSDGIPHLAAQRAGYLEKQLNAFKDGTRKNPLMNAIAAQLNADDIANVAAHFAGQAGAAAGARSGLLAHVAKSNVPFPEGYKESFVKYHTINFPATRQVRYYYANRAAVGAAKAGKPMPDGAMLFAEVYAARLGADQKPVTGADGFRHGERRGLGREHSRAAAQRQLALRRVHAGREAAPGRQSGRVPRVSQAARCGELRVHAQGTRRLEIAGPFKYISPFPAG